MARLVRAFGSSHSAMQMAALDGWLAMFDHIDRKSPVYDFDGEPRGFDDLVASRPATAERLLSRPEIERRYAIPRQRWTAWPRRSRRPRSTR